MMPDFQGGPVKFLKEVKTELIKVQWPTKDEVVKLTVIVLVVSLVFGLYIGGLDMIFTQITNIIIGV